MTTIYIIDPSGQKIEVTVTEAVAAADAETRRAIWRNNAKEKYYRSPKLQNLSDKDIELESNCPSPEEVLIKAEERAELRAKLIAGLKSLSLSQLTLIKMLKSGMSVNDIAAKFGVDKSAISHRRKRIQEKLKKFLK